MTIGVRDARITKLKLEIKINGTDLSWLWQLCDWNTLHYWCVRIHSKIIQYEITVRLFWVWPNHLSSLCCKLPSWWKYSVQNHSGTGLFWVQPTLYVAIGIIANTLHHVPKLSSSSSSPVPIPPPHFVFKTTHCAQRFITLNSLTLFSQPCTVKTNKILGSSFRIMQTRTDWQCAACSIEIGLTLCLLMIKGMTVSVMK